MVPQARQNGESASPDVEKADSKPAMPSFPEGGLMGWLCVAGSWLVLFATFGYANAFGVFQAYYATGYPNETPSNISWIGSIQLFFQFSLGAVAGPLYDKGYFRQLVAAGTVIYVVCLFMTSLCKTYWQTILAQGLGVGIGIGLLFLPAVSILSQYFFRRRSLAIGIAVTGSSVGGICLPIMLNNLIQSHGFERAVQYTGYLIMGVLILAFCLMHPRLPPNHSTAPKPSPKEIFDNLPYSLLVAGLFTVCLGLFFPFYYLQVFAEAHRISPNLTFYTLAILNAASVFGRISPNFLADFLGPLRLLSIMTFGAGVLAFATFGAASSGGLVVVAILYGFFSGAYVSLLSPALISMARNHNEIGIRLGLAFLVVSLAALTGTPITGALLDRYGFYAPIIFSGVTILTGTAFFVASTAVQARRKGTWKV